MGSQLEPISLKREQVQPIRSSSKEKKEWERGIVKGLFLQEAERCWRVLVGSHRTQGDSACEALFSLEIYTPSYTRFKPLAAFPLEGWFYFILFLLSKYSWHMGTSYSFQSKRHLEVIYHCLPWCNNTFSISWTEQIPTKYPPNIAYLFSWIRFSDLIWLLLNWTQIKNNLIQLLFGCTWQYQTKLQAI